MQRQFGILTFVIIFSIIFYAIGSFLAVYFANYLIKFLHYEFTQTEEIVYGGLAILILGWIILTAIIKSKERKNKEYQEIQKLVNKRPRVKSNIKKKPKAIKNRN